MGGRYERSCARGSVEPGRGSWFAGVTNQLYRARQR